MIVKVTLNYVYAEEQVQKVSFSSSSPSTATSQNSKQFSTNKCPQHSLKVYFENICEDFIQELMCAGENLLVTLLKTVFQEKYLLNSMLCICS